MINAAALLITGVLPIVGGTLDTGSSAVGAILFPDMETGELKRTCTGTLVSPRVVLTAAKCVVDEPSITAGEIRFGNDFDNPNLTVGFADVRLHRFYDPVLPLARYDMAVILLADPVVDFDPVVLNETRLEEVIDTTDGEDDFVRGVGFGDTIWRQQEPKNTLRRTIQLSMAGIGVHEYTQGEDGASLCTGDTGGPDFYISGGQEVMVGLHADTHDAENGPPGCTGFDVSARIDRQMERFIIRAIDVWDGPCPLDGTCTTDGCRSVDPDCDPCEPDGECATGCAKGDWDCPVGELVGEFCETDEDCEDRRCVEATDEPRLKYCTTACNTIDAVAFCGEDLDCVDVAGESLCIYPTPTPGAQGSRCEDGVECRSGLCDIEFLICVEECDPAAASSCPSGYQCLPSSIADNVCRPDSVVPVMGCGCETSGAAPFGGILAAMLALLPLLLRRRARELE